MPKWLLYVIIFALLGTVVYLVFGGDTLSKRDPKKTETYIEVSEPTITRTEPVATTSADEPEAAILIAISGRLVRFEEVPERGTGQLNVYALVDDGTEFITIDMHRVVSPGVSAPEDQLGLTIGQHITVHGELIDGMFVAREIE